jgi:hypothetical protein
VEAKWWGYQLILTQRAVDTLVECLDYIDAKLTKIIPNKEIRAVIRLILDIKKFRLTRVSKKTGSQGCRLVSPWICPVALVVVRNKADADLGLYTSVWDSSNNTWGEESAFNDIESATGPALAQFRDRLYCVYRGKDDDTNMYWMHYTSADGWSDGSAEDKYPDDMRPKKFPAHQTTGVPTLVVFNDKLYCFHKGGKDDQSLWCCTLNPDRNSWSPDVKINAAPDTSGYNRTVNTNYGTAAAVFNNKLHLVFPEKNHKYLYHITSEDGSNWSMISPISDSKGDAKGEDIPALAVYKSKLYLLIRGCDEKLWNTDSADGVTWSTLAKMSEYKTWEGPSLAVFDNKLIVVHRSGDKKADLYYATYDGNTSRAWSADTRFTEGQVTGDNPALAVYMDPNAKPESYEDPSHGGAKLIVAYRGS